MAWPWPSSVLWSMQPSKALLADVLATGRKIRAMAFCRKLRLTLCCGFTMRNDGKGLWENAVPVDVILLLS